MIININLGEIGVYKEFVNHIEDTPNEKAYMATLTKLVGLFNNSDPLHTHAHYMKELSDYMSMVIVENRFPMMFYYDIDDQ